MKIQINNQNFDLTESFQTYLEEKFSALDKYQEDIISFQVYLGRDQKHKKGDVFAVEAMLALPDKKSIVIKEVSNDPRKAVDMVQDKLSRQLVKYKDKKISRLRKSKRKFKSLKFWRRNNN